MRDHERYEPPPMRRPWSLDGLLDHLFSFLIVTVVGWLLSIVLEWCGMALGWWDQPGAGHSEHLLRTELAWLKQDFQGTAASERLIPWAYEGARLLYQWSGLEALIRWVVTDPGPGVSGLAIVRAGLRQSGDYLLAAAYVTQLTGVRLAVVLYVLPAFVLLGVVGAVDGLVQRDLRRFGGGPESGFMYHHLKKMIRPMLSLPVFLYLVLPWSVHPTVLFIPFALGLGYFMQRTLSRFKKYL